MVLTKDMSKDYTKFMNFFMAEIYNVMFQKRLPRVLPEMRATLEHSIDSRIGDWFLFKNGMVNRLYGFTHSPYLVSSFLNPRFFFMDLIKQKPTVEA